MEVPKYKCPTCHAPYCSVACYKTHKQTPCVKKKDEGKDPEPGAGKELEVETEDQVPAAKLLCLESDKAVKDCLANRHLRELLVEINSTQDPVGKLKKCMEYPVFKEFADACLRVCGRTSHLDLPEEGDS